MKTQNQKRKSFTKEMERLKTENKLLEEQKLFGVVLKKAVITKKRKPSSR